MIPTSGPTGEFPLGETARGANKGAPVIPLALHLEADALQVDWSDARHRIPTVRLRACCRCAECQRLSLTGAAMASAADVQLIGASPVGSYAIQLHFSDGHQRGIYPWTLLREIGEAADIAPPSKHLHKALLPAGPAGF